MKSRIDDIYNRYLGPRAETPDLPKPCSCVKEPQHAGGFKRVMHVQSSNDKERARSSRSELRHRLHRTEICAEDLRESPAEPKTVSYPQRIAEKALAYQTQAEQIVRRIEVLKNLRPDVEALDRAVMSKSRDVLNLPLLWQMEEIFSRCFNKEKDEAVKESWNNFTVHITMKPTSQTEVKVAVNEGDWLKVSMKPNLVTRLAYCSKTHKLALESDPRQQELSPPEYDTFKAGEDHTSPPVEVTPPSNQDRAAGVSRIDTILTSVSQPSKFQQKTPSFQAGTGVMRQAFSSPHPECCSEDLSAQAVSEFCKEISLRAAKDGRDSGMLPDEVAKEFFAEDLKGTDDLERESDEVLREFLLPTVDKEEAAGWDVEKQRTKVAVKRLFDIYQETFAKFHKLLPLTARVLQTSVKGMILVMERSMRQVQRSQEALEGLLSEFARAKEEHTKSEALVATLQQELAHSRFEQESCQRLLDAKSQEDCYLAQQMGKRLSTLDSNLMTKHDGIATQIQEHIENVARGIEEQSRAQKASVRQMLDAVKDEIIDTMKLGKKNREGVFDEGATADKAVQVRMDRRNSATSEYYSESAAYWEYMAYVESLLFPLKRDKKEYSYAEVLCRVDQFVGFAANSGSRFVWDCEDTAVLDIAHCTSMESLENGLRSAMFAFFSEMDNEKITETCRDYVSFVGSLRAQTVPLCRVLLELLDVPNVPGTVCRSATMRNYLSLFFLKCYSILSRIWYSCIIIMPRVVRARGTARCWSA